MCACVCVCVRVRERSALLELRVRERERESESLTDFSQIVSPTLGGFYQDRTNENVSSSKHMTLGSIKRRRRISDGTILRPASIQNSLPTYRWMKEITPAPLEGGVFRLDQSSHFSRCCKRHVLSFKIEKKLVLGYLLRNSRLEHEYVCMPVFGMHASECNIYRGCQTNLGDLLIHNGKRFPFARPKDFLRETKHRVGVPPLVVDLVQDKFADLYVSEHMCACAREQGHRTSPAVMEPGGQRLSSHGNCETSCSSSSCCTKRKVLGHLLSCPDQSRCLWSWNCWSNSHGLPASATLSHWEPTRPQLKQWKPTLLLLMMTHLLRARQTTHHDQLQHPPPAGVRICSISSHDEENRIQKQA